MWKYPIIDLHATWLVMNPIQGCPNRCKYCFLNGINLTGKKPEELVQPEEAVKLLKESRLYNKEIPICIESQTDAFATPANIKYVMRLLEELDKEKIMNPKIFITKCGITEEFITKVEELKNKGHKFVFFLSYSGLDNDIEIGIDNEKIKNNFIKLFKANLDIVHYWRPFIPQNSSKDKILEVYNFVKNYAKCSIAIGLKVQDNILENMKFWPDLINKENVTKAESVWDKNAYESIYLNNTLLNNDYPIYQTTSCALAYVLKQGERNAFYNEKECLNYNKCPESQRKICEKYYKKNLNITENQVFKMLDDLKIEYSKENTQIKINEHKKGIEITNIELEMKEFTYLTQMTKHKIYANKDEKDYYWNTSVNNANKIFL